MELPQHPARGAQAQPEQAPVNPYYKSNPALAAAEAGMRSQTQPMPVMASQGGLGAPMAPPVQEGPTPSQQLADSILGGSIDPASLQALVQSGQVTPDMANEAVMMAQSAMQPQQGGLGSL